MTIIAHINPDGSEVLVSVGEFTEISPGVYLGENVQIGDRTIIKSGKIGDNTTIGCDCSILGGNIGSDVNIGSYIRICAGCILGDGCSIENYIELAKQTKIPANSRVIINSNHGLKEILPEPEPDSDKSNNFE